MADANGKHQTGELALIRGIRERAARSSDGRGSKSVRARGLTPLRERAQPRSARSAVALGIGDDCAILRPPPGDEVLVTTDMSLEGRHFDRRLHPPESVGHRCLTRGLSDLAAMGARPLAAFLSLALPAGTQRTAQGRNWVDRFFDGLFALADSSGTQLAGGDTAAAPGTHVLADIVLLGSAPHGTALRRSGARPGDLLYVTGALGGSAAEFARLRPRRTPRVESAGGNPHLFPQPRLRTGFLLRQRKIATAAIDLSDGLSTDLRHLCQESGVGAVVEQDALPIHPLARNDEDAGLNGALNGPLDGALHRALHGGEDYELLFTARPATRVPRRLAGVPIHCIGYITRSRRIVLSHRDSTSPLDARGWEHAF